MNNKKDNIWNVSLIRINLIDDIKKYLHEIGKELEKSTDLKLTYDIKIYSETDLSISFDFNVLYNYKDYDSKIPYKLFKIKNYHNKISINTNYFLNSKDDNVETFSDFKSYIEDMISSEDMGITLSRILEICEINNVG